MMGGGGWGFLGCCWGWAAVVCSRNTHEQPKMQHSSPALSWPSVPAAVRAGGGRDQCPSSTCNFRIQVLCGSTKPRCGASAARVAAYPGVAFMSHADASGDPKCWPKRDDCHHGGALRIYCVRVLTGLTHTHLCIGQVHRFTRFGYGYLFRTVYGATNGEGRCLGMKCKMN